MVSSKTFRGLLSKWRHKSDEKYKQMARDLNAAITQPERRNLDWFKQRQIKRGMPTSFFMEQVITSDFTNKAQHMQRGHWQEDFTQKVGEFQDDYTNFVKPSDDLYSTTATGGDYDGVFNLFDLQYLGDRRVGVGNNITWGAERNATRNWFQFADPDNLNPFRNETTKKVFKEMVSTDFKRQSYPWGAHERQFGVGYIVMHWKDNDDMATPAPKMPPKRFEAVSPIHLTPHNTFKSRGVSWDPEVWEFNNGHMGLLNSKSFKIHRSRIKVMLTRPNANDWRGLSVMDPCAISLASYMNGMIFLLRAFAKFGNMVSVWKTASEHPEEDEILERMDLQQEFSMNGNYVIGKNDSVEFPNTNIANGLYQAMEIWKEDIASSVQIPINHLFMRNVGGGLSDGDLTAERTYMNTLANIQMDRTDDYLDIWLRWYPELADKTLLWNVAIQRTRMQELMIASQETQNKLLDEQLKQQKVATKQAKMNMEMMEMQMEILKSSSLMTPEESETVATAEAIEDFAPRQIDRGLWDDFTRLAHANSILLNNQIQKKNE